MTIELKPVDKHNWEECIKLKVKPEQEKYIASNLYSIAQYQFLQDFEMMAIEAGEKIVGFAMYGLDEDDHNYWIYRIMIDHREQGKGYGKAALREILIRLKEKPDCKEIVIGYDPENKAAEHLYLGEGFEQSGIASWGEMLVRYKMGK